jgi:hypothetical protein
MARGGENMNEIQSMPPETGPRFEDNDMHGTKSKTAPRHPQE